MRINTFRYLVVFLAVIMLAWTAAPAQETVPIGIEDLRQLRKLAADRDFQKDRADAAVEQVVAWQKSSTDWKALYLSEKDRADRVQGGRVDNLQSAVDQFKIQAAADRQRIGELTFDLRKANGAKKWYFGTGFVTGAVAGGFVGVKSCKQFGL